MRDVLQVACQNANLQPPENLENLLTIAVTESADSREVGAEQARHKDNSHKHAPNWAEPMWDIQGEWKG